MNTIQATASYYDGKYFVYTNSEIGISTIGSTIDEAKKAFMHYLTEYKSLCEEAETAVPNELLDDYEVNYNYETSVILQLLPISLKALSEASGINQRQLSAYKNGLKTPRKETKAKITKGINDIGCSLIKVTLL